MVDYNLELLRTFGLYFFPDGWSIAEIGDLLAQDKGISVGVMYPGDNTPDGIPLIKAGDLKNNWVNPNPEFSISKEKHEEYRRTELLGGELLVSLVGNAGQTVVVPKEMCGWNVARAVAVLRLSEAVTPKYLQYCLQSPTLTSIIKSWCNTTVQETLNLKEIKKLPIPLPTSDEQHAIAHILGTLDDKIELNQKMNQTLEDIAKAIFKSWFVEFDPVRAKAEGRPTGLPPEISDLFPDELVESEIGEIPKGWEIMRLGECAIEIESGRRPKGGIDKSLRQGIPSVGAESIAPAGEFDFSKVKYVTAEFAEKMKKGRVQNFDVALYKDGGKPGQFIPRVGIYGDGFPFGHFYVNEHVFLLRSEQLGQPFLYRLVSSQAFLDQLIAKGSAKAAQPGLNQTEVVESTFVRPSKATIAIFNDKTRSLLERQFLLGRENEVLSDLRDTILPKLISGELRIADAEKFLEEAGI